MIISVILRAKPIVILRAKPEESFLNRGIPSAGSLVHPGSAGVICEPDYAHYLCFAPKHMDGAPAKKKRFRVAPPRFGTKLQSFAINLPTCAA